MNLNEEQLAVLEHTKGNVITQAGPGTGKTTTLNAYTDNLIDIQNIAANQILTLMFNKSIRKEIKNRQSKTNMQSTVHTFHSFSLSLVSDHYKLLGFTARPTTTTKGTKRKNQISYNEMLSLALKLAKSHPKQFKKSVGHYQYLLVDELQDVNKQHTQLILHLSKHIDNVIMFGDKKQAINGFMGADIKYWKQLEEKLRPKSFQLTTTYRLDDVSLPFINRVGKEIAPNDLPLVSNNKNGKKIIYRRNTEDSPIDKNKQAEFIADRITKLIVHGIAPNQIVCLGRTNKQLVQLYNALLGHGLHTDRLYIDRTTTVHLTMVKQILSLSLWYKAHKRQRNHTLHVHFPVLIKKLLKLLGVNNKQDRLVITESIKEEGLEGFHVSNDINETLYRDLLSFRKTVNNIAECDEPERAIQIIIFFLSPVLKRHYNQKGDNRFKLFMRQDLSDLKVISRGYDCLSIDVVDALRLPSIQTGDRVQLATCNYAKGKEWDYVFVIHVVDGVFPHYKSKKDDDKLDEELRLFYVAVTRHREQLCLIECPLHERGYTHISNTYSRGFIEPSHFMEI